MRRKIIKQGNNSYTITLPIKWIRDENIEDDSEVDIEQEGKELSIKIPSDIKRAEALIRTDLKDYNNTTIQNVLFCLYRKGYDKIAINYTNKEQMDEIRRIVKKALLGFEIVEEKTNECVIANIAEPSEDKYEIILRKIMLSIKEDSEMVLNDFKKSKFNNFKKISESKNFVDTYTNFCRRLILKYKIGGSKVSYFNYLLVSRLSLLYHIYYYAYKAAVAEKKIKISSYTLDLLEQSNKLFILFYDAFYTKDVNKLDRVTSIKNSLYKKLYSDFPKVPSRETPIYFHIGELIRTIHLSTISIFGILDFEQK